jgi:hypothetical protein
MSATATKSKSSGSGKRGTGKGTKSTASKAKAASAKAANKDGGKRLSPGGLNGLVLGYMKKHKGQLPITRGQTVLGRRRQLPRPA